MWFAGETTTGGPSEALIYATATFLGVVVTTIGLIVQQQLKSRNERTAPSPPSAMDGAQAYQMVREMGSLVQRADDNDERDDIQDRRHENAEGRLDRIEDWIADNDPGWRTP